MARDLKISKLLSHITACRTATLPGERLPFYIGADQVGYVKPDFAARLAACPDISVTDKVVLAVSAAPRLNEIAKGAGSRIRFEDFDVRAVVDGPVLAVLDRGALPDFGVIGVGAHLNGLVQKPDGWHLWVAKRAADKKLDPGKLDHLVAGGVSVGMTPFETLVKEAGEEAGLPEDLASQAKFVCQLHYNMERPEGLRRDVLYAYDCVLPDQFHPEPADGEVESFELWPLERVFERVCSSDDFKFNVNLVLIDLFIRFALVTGADAALLRAALNF
ncbi:MAG: thiamine pyrophosphokinase [Acidocella sp. 20-57-95]|nr:MAG: thiamine pyrophosphokinase [Acidocella sp. 20-57-95]OYV59524.1 MAG: thiamine pyrophosphokinase [Acidocella sp. 21-58-7]HQT65167.1 NUDIX domain-containing protein [Acidocella sp.]HQU04557.1 NUDIX domain-containing protein [Acidocella sp.]